jgi:predicted nucleotidyltransferase
MRTSRPLDALFPRTRQAILATTLLAPDRVWYLSLLARHLHVQPSSLQRELAGLVDAGLLRRHVDGNRVYYGADPTSPLLLGLQILLAKTIGLADVVRDALQPFAPRIRWAFLYGSIARGEELASSDVDLLIVGDVRLSELAPRLRIAEQTLSRPVNATLYTPAEFATKRRARHHFLASVLRSPIFPLLGSEADLVPAAHRAPRATTRDEQARTRRAQSSRRARLRRRSAPRFVR